MGRGIFLILELTIIFVLVPLLIYRRVLPNLPIPFLIVVAIAAFLRLRHDPQFDASRLWNAGAAWQHLGPMLLRDAALLAILGIAAWQWKPELLFSLVKRAPV